MFNNKLQKTMISVIGAVSIFTAADLGLNQQMIKLPQTEIVKAATNNVAARSYGVDVSSYQSSSLISVAKAGAQFAIVKVSEGTTYRNPKGASQIKSALANNMLPMAYHFATFGANSLQSGNEGKYAASSAKAMGLPAGSYIACDWETGDGNIVNGSKNANTTAILAFMDQVKAAGYQPLLYSGAYLLNNNVNTQTVLAKYPNALWVASYATMGRIDTPNFSYFPSMDGVAIWQFTDNWRGLNIDGNISLLPLSTGSNASTVSNTNNSSNTNVVTNSSTSQAPTKKAVTTQKTIMHKAFIYDKNGSATGRAIGAYNRITVYGGLVKINGSNFYRIGDNEYVKLGNVDGTNRNLHHNAYVYNNRGRRVYVPTLRRGASIVTYGSSFRINGKRYYRINRNRYVKVANF